MTSTARWGALAVVIGLLAFFVSRGILSRDSEEAGARFEVDRDAQGYVFYQRLGCPRCHGDTMQGTHRGPSLREISSYFDSAALLRYLDNPDSAQIVDPRLNRLDLEYSEHEMPSFPLRPQAAQTLVNFLLAPSKALEAHVNDRQNLQP